VSPGEAISVAVHSSDEFPEDEESPLPNRLRDVNLVTAAATYNVTNLHLVDETLQGQANVKGKGYSWLVGRYGPQVMVVEARDFNNYLRDEGLLHVIDARAQDNDLGKAARERYTKYAKALLLSAEPNEFYKTPVGHPLEIVPQQDPLRKKAATLSVQVLLRGKPAAGLQIGAIRSRQPLRDAKSTAHTDENGLATIPLNGPGRYKLRAVAMERASDPKTADWESFWATLTFEVR
jgi:hypothetical protein